MSNNILSRYGWKRDGVDNRDLVLRLGPPNLDGVPTKVDLREHCSTVENQTTLGSCTANAAAGALEYLEIKKGNVGEKFENFSRLYVYYNMREIQGTLNEDSGGTMRDTMKALNKLGACDELLWGYDVEKFRTKPIDECYKDAENHKISEYSRLETFPDMVKCLADGFPFVFGFMVYTQFEGPQVAKTGVLQMPTPGEEFRGGHAVCAVGYNMDEKTILVRNSWGEGWGQDGYFTMPFSYISSPMLAQDFWTIRK
jgi:C1A family cysteine protease